MERKNENFMTAPVPVYNLLLLKDYPEYHKDDPAGQLTEAEKEKDVCILQLGEYNYKVDRDVFMAADDSMFSSDKPMWLVQEAEDRTRLQVEDYYRNVINPYMENTRLQLYECVQEQCRKHGIAPHTLEELRHIARNGTTKDRPCTRETAQSILDGMKDRMTVLEKNLNKYEREKRVVAAAYKREKLEELLQQVQGRITDIREVPSQNGRVKLRCKVDGVQHMAVTLSEDASMILRNTPAERFLKEAEKWIGPHFKDLLLNPSVQQKKGYSL